MAKDLYVKDLSEKGGVEIDLSVHSIEIKQTRNGDDFIRLELGDRTGTIIANHWTCKSKPAEKILECVSEGAVIRVRGSLGEYMNHLSITISPNKGEGISPLMDYEISDFKYTVEKDEKEMFAKIMGEVESIQDPYLKKLITNLFEDNEIRKAFMECPAAKRYHHNYLGGLLEHTLGVMELCLTIQSQYNQLNRDILIAGSIFHDIGKIKSYSYEGITIGFTEEGTNISHIVSGDEMLRAQIGKIEDFPQETGLKLRNMILSHHGKVEQGWGSAADPRSPEAFALHYADLMDSQVKGMLED